MAHIHELIPRIMAEVGVIEKNRRNDHFKYNFRGVDDIAAAFQPALIKHGVCCIPEVMDHQVTERPSSKGGVTIFTILKVKFTFYASDGSSISAVVIGEGSDQSDKSSNKAMSAAMKYCYLQAFCVPSEAMEDSDRDTSETEHQRASRPQAVPRPQAQTKSGGYGGVVDGSSTEFWSRRAHLGVDHAQARKIVENHTSGSAIDWAGAIEELRQLQPA